jgi:nickel/cobalt exporter
MLDLQSLLEIGLGSPTLLLPAALLLGALHALEPGHSKSMMTAFIVAIHGTARQAALLGVSATAGHTAVVWILALMAWRLGDAGLLERVEPWLLIGGGLILVALALRILTRQWRRGAGHAHHHHHHLDHDHHHHHHTNDPQGGHGHSHGAHDHHHHDDAGHGDLDEDRHAAAHEAEIKTRFTGGPVSDSEVAWFGFSGGLMPCPAAFAVLLACLHQGAYGQGVVTVAAFSVGLALMLVAIGLAAAWSADALRSRIGLVDKVAGWAPYVSALIVLILGLVAIVEGAQSLQ